MSVTERWYDLAEAQAEVVAHLGLDLTSPTAGYDQTARNHIDRVVDLDALFAEVITSCPNDDGTPAWCIQSSPDALIEIARRHQR